MRFLIKLAYTYIVNDRTTNPGEQFTKKDGYGAENNEYSMKNSKHTETKSPKKVKDEGKEKHIDNNNNFQ
jgi:hypothetical protein